MFHGSIVALVTPMTEGGDIDFAAWSRLVEHHVTAGTHALVVGGTTGESPTLKVGELTRLVSAARDVVAGRVPVIAGSGSNSTEHSIELTCAVRDAGADAALVVTPYYNKPEQEGLFRHFSAVADCGLPVLLYNVPGRTGCDLEPATVARLAPHPHIVGIKEATGDVRRGEAILAACDDAFVLLSGDDPTALDLMKIGARGVVSVTANVAPAAMAAMCVAMLDENESAAREIDARLRALHDAMFVAANPIPVKWGVCAQGWIGPGIRLPLTPLDARHIPRLRTAMDEAGVL